MLHALGIGLEFDFVLDAASCHAGHVVNGWLRAVLQGFGPARAHTAKEDLQTDFHLAEAWTSTETQ